MDLEDDSDNDSDYNPAEDKTCENDEIEDETEKKLEDISFSRKRKSNELWEEMQQEEQAVFAKTSKVLNILAGKPKVKKSEKNEQILAQIFGKSVAKKLSVTTSASKTSGDMLNQSGIKDLIKDSVDKVQKRQKVTEKVKFAGGAISVTKTVLGATKTAPAVKPVANIDKVMDILKGPKTISTVTKSAFDWDNYKEQEGLEDELAGASKEGFLARKDFLNRCDVRAFEGEKEKRLANVAKRS